MTEGEEQWWAPQVTFTAGNVEIVWVEARR
jgi:hypothetical protein